MKQENKNPYYTSLMMGEQSGDFAMHTGEVFGQMFKNAPIAKKDIPKINEFIRNLGMPIKVKQTMPDGTVKNVGKTIKPFADFPSVADPDAMLNYIRNLPTGTHRAYFLKGLDKAGLQKMGVPRVGDARLAVADPAQIGMDWGTTGYRGFVPDLKEAHCRPLEKTLPLMTLVWTRLVNLKVSLKKVEVFQLICFIAIYQHKDVKLELVVVL